MSYMRSIHRFELFFNELGEYINNEEEGVFNEFVGNLNIVQFTHINIGVGYEKFVGKTSDGLFLIQENVETGNDSSIITIQLFSNEDEFVDSVEKIVPFNSTKEFFEKKLKGIVSPERKFSF